MSKQSLELVLNSEHDTQALAKSLALANLTGSVWLSGDLGAGKTTLARYWLQALGHLGTVKSPTYTLVEPYELSPINEQNQLTIKRVYHADLYRLQDPEELSFIGFEEYLEDDEALIIIEWASRALDYLPQPIMTIEITTGEKAADKSVVDKRTVDESNLVQRAVDQNTVDKDTMAANLNNQPVRYVKINYNSEINIEWPTFSG